MPEGPEIRRQADELAEVLNEQYCVGIEFGLPRLHRYSEALDGVRILKATSWGKAMLIHFENGMSIYSHNQLYGRWWVTKSRRRPETTRQQRLAVDTRKGSALLYSASDIEVMPTAELSSHPFLSRLGPDVLDESTTDSVIEERLTSTEFSRRQLASLLLDQHFLAGLGNYLRSEILYYASLMPSRKPSELSMSEINKLSRTINAITVRSYKTKGITVPENVYQALVNQGAGFEQARFAIFNKEGETCLVSGESIKRENRGGRRIYFCSQCQQ